MDYASDFRILLSTVNHEEIAVRIAKLLVEERLVACVNIVPKIRSVYRWKDKIENEEEYLLFMKCQSHRLQEIEDLLLAQHPYETPEILTLTLDQGNKRYLDWIVESTTPLERS